MMQRIIASITTIGFWLWLGLDIHKNDKKHGVDSWVIPIFYGLFFGGIMLLAIWCT